ncbi:class I SAM-dependent methyltransferase [Paractinoplanes ferrugineus]|nr:class I SAM-dependent methyltransferase [Actinoplanes ferrugineus]
MAETDWVRWHEDYETPGSSLARRLVVVQRFLDRVLDTGEPRSLLALCAGDGRDVLPVLAARPAGRQMRAVLVEFDPSLSGRARTAAAALGLPGVEVRTADAGRPASFADAVPVDVLLACGVFGNVSDGDMRRTVAALPSFLTPGGVVIWTRGRGTGDGDLSEKVRASFAAGGFAELAFEAPADAGFRVGMARLTEPAAAPAPDRLFTFR